MRAGFRVELSHVLFIFLLLSIGCASEGKHSQPIIPSQDSFSQEITREPPGTDDEMRFSAGHSL